MNCPRCGKEISEELTLCPFCHAEIDADMEFNDYKRDGFIQLKKHTDEEDDLLLRPKEDKVTYFKLTEMNIFVVAVVFILIIAVVTIFGLKALQTWSNDTPSQIVIPEYTITVTEPPTEPTIPNTVKNVSIENLYGSWTYDDYKDSENQAIPYYTFAEGGIAQYNYGSLTVTGTFKDFSTEDENIVYITIEEKLSGMFVFDVTGNKNDGYTLVLTNDNTQRAEIFVSSTAKTYTLDSITDFEIDEEILGKWVTEDKTKSYEFKEDGSLVRIFGTQTMKAVYSCMDENIIQIKYMDYTIKTTNLKYTLLGDAMVINDSVYYKENSTSEN